jgi:hypothetical protein
MHNHERTKTQTTTTTIMSLLTIFESSEHDDEFENSTSTSCSPSPASPSRRRSRGMPYDFKKQFHSPRMLTIKRGEARWDNHTLILEKPLCSPIRCRSPSRGGVNTGPSRDTLPSGKQDLGFRMPLRSLPSSMPPKLDRLPRMPNLNERSQDSIILTFDLV